MDWKYFSSISEGLLIGIPMSFALGPVFFTLIQNSIENGLKSALYIALGVIIGDLFLLFLAFSGVQYLVPNGGSVEFWIQISGAALLFILGLNNIFKKTTAKYVSAKYKNRLYFLGNGFALNVLNPANFFAWVAVISYAEKVAKYNSNQNVLFYLGVLVAVFTTEMSISVSATKLKKILNDRVIHAINVTTGILFIGFGAFLLIKAFA